MTEKLIIVIPPNQDKEEIKKLKAHQAQDKKKIQNLQNQLNTLKQKSKS